MDIYLTEKSSGDRLRIPLLPDRLSIKTGALSVAVSIIKTGEVKIPRGSSLTTYAWNGVFPSEAMENASFVFDWQEPARIVSQLKEWEESGSILEFMVTELSINEDVFIESFTGDYYGMGDFSYSIALTAKRELTITTVAAPSVPAVSEDETPNSSDQYGTVKTNGSNLNIREKASTSSAVIGKLPNGSKVEILGKTGNWYIVPCSAGTNGKGYAYSSYIKLINGSDSGSSSGSGSSSSSSGSSSGSSNKKTTTSSTGGTSYGSYTVKQGDTLYTIAKAMLGNGTRYMEIYNLNKTAIDKWRAGKTVSSVSVPVGMVLKLPAYSTAATTSTKKSTSTTYSKVASAVSSAASSAVKTVTTAVSKVVTSKPVSTLINVVKTAAQKAIATKTTTSSSKPTTVKNNKNNVSMK